MALTELFIGEHFTKMYDELKSAQHRSYILFLYDDIVSVSNHIYLEIDMKEFLR